MFNILNVRAQNTEREQSIVQIGLWVRGRVEVGVDFNYIGKLRCQVLHRTIQYIILGQYQYDLTHHTRPETRGRGDRNVNILAENWVRSVRKALSAKVVNSDVT